MRKLTLALLSLLAACGGSPEAGTPPGLKAGEDDEFFALENGSYFIERVLEINDGCRRNPLDPSDPITAVAFDLKNDGKGTITLDRCIFNGKSTTGFITNNRGTMSILHSRRTDGGGSAVAEYQQECRMDVTVTGDNKLEARFSEQQRNRNDVLKRISGIPASECTTSYTFTMGKR